MRRIGKKAATVLAMAALGWPLVGNGAESARITLMPPGESPEHIELGALPKKVGPEAGVFGVPLGASFDQALERLGPANGLLRLGGGRTALTYGRSFILVFEEGKLIRAGYERASFMGVSLDGDPHPFFDDTQWELGPGVKPGMAFPEVMERLGRPDAEPDYEVTYVADNGVRVTLDFASSRMNGGEPTFSLHGFWLRTGGSVGSARPFEVAVPAGPGE